MAVAPDKCRHDGECQTSDSDGRATHLQQPDQGEVTSPEQLRNQRSQTSGHKNGCGQPQYMPQPIQSVHIGPGISSSN